MYSEKNITVCNAVYFRLRIDLMHILPPVTAEGFDGSHHPRFTEWHGGVFPVRPITFRSFAFRPTFLPISPFASRPYPFCPLPFCPIATSPSYRFAHLPFRPFANIPSNAISPLYHFAHSPLRPMPFCPFIISPLYHFVTLFQFH